MILFIVFGLILGSFLSVLLARLPRRWRGEPTGIVAGRSECPHCKHVLGWYDLVPLASYAILGGKCRYCRAGISSMYPALEATMAGVFGFSAFHLGTALDLVVLFGLVALFFFDLRYQLLPDAITVPLVGVAAFRVFVQHISVVNATLTALVLAGVLGALYLVSRGRWLGLGDVKLAVIIGLLFGAPTAVTVTILAIWAGALWGIALILLGRATRKTALPFGAFWAAVAIFTILWPAPIQAFQRLFIP